MVTFLKVLLVVILCAICSYAAWMAQGARKDAALTDAVDAVRRDAQQQLDAEHALFYTYLQESRTHFGQVLDAIGDLRTSGAVRGAAITQEVKADPPFYTQPLPAKGYELWMSAHHSFVSSSSSSGWLPSSSSTAAPTRSDPARSTPKAKPR